MVMDQFMTRAVWPVIGAHLKRVGNEILLTNHGYLYMLFWRPMCLVSAPAGPRKHHRVLQQSPAARSQLPGGRRHHQVINHIFMLSYLYLIDSTLKLHVHVDQ